MAEAEAEQADLARSGLLINFGTREHGGHCHTGTTEIARSVGALGPKSKGTSKGKVHANSKAEIMGDDDCRDVDNCVRGRGRVRSGATFGAGGRWRRGRLLLVRVRERARRVHCCITRSSL
jgi:hypothetical protein